MGEAKFKASRVLEAISQAVGVETSAGRIQVRWDTDAATTPVLRQSHTSSGVFHSQWRGVG